jgi:hypothetical protein
MLEEHLAVPFMTEILGVAARVDRVDLNAAEEIVAICRRGPHRQSIPILDLPPPLQPPEGWEWIEAYRHWARGAVNQCATPPSSPRSARRPPTVFVERLRAVRAARACHSASWTIAVFGGARDLDGATPSAGALAFT